MQQKSNFKINQKLLLIYILSISGMRETAAELGGKKQQNQLSLAFFILFH